MSIFCVWQAIMTSVRYSNEYHRQRQAVYRQRQKQKMLDLQAEIDRLRAERAGYIGRILQLQRCVSAYEKQYPALRIRKES